MAVLTRRGASLDSRLAPHSELASKTTVVTQCDEGHKFVPEILGLDTGE
ncbi:MAG: hypothetical protein Q7S20_11635 [Gemmatimonadaceae bacterium]|nr:hypothetical protein [Gemmatimonadaceae bacterium]